MYSTNMYNTKMFTRVVECQKTLFDNSFAILATLQDQGHQMMDLAFEKSPLLPDDSKKMCSYWVDFAKQNRESCKEYFDSSFDRTKEFFAESKPVSSAESKPVSSAESKPVSSAVKTSKKSE